MSLTNLSPTDFVYIKLMEVDKWKRGRKPITDTFIGYSILNLDDQKVFGCQHGFANRYHKYVS